MRKVLRCLVCEEEGQDMVEYALILGFVAVGAAAIIASLGTDVKTVWTITSNHMSNSASTATAS